MGRMYVAQPPSAGKTRDRNRRPRLRAHFHFNQSACWFSWPWALDKQNQMAAPGSDWGKETLGKVMREETYRGGVLGNQGFIKLVKHRETRRRSVAPHDGRLLRREEVETLKKSTFLLLFLLFFEEDSVCDNDWTGCRALEKSEPTGREVSYYSE